MKRESINFFLKIYGKYYEKANKEREKENIFHKAYRDSLTINPFKSSLIMIQS